MAADNVTLPGSEGKAFEADANIYVATLRAPGGSITNPPGEDTVYIRENDDDAAGIAADGTGGIPVPAGCTWPLNPTTKAFSFRCAVGESAVPLYKPRG